MKGTDTVLSRKARSVGHDSSADLILVFGFGYSPDSTGGSGTFRKKTGPILVCLADESLRTGGGTLSTHLEGTDIVFSRVVLPVGRDRRAAFPFFFIMLGSLITLGLPEPAEKKLAQYSHF